MFASPSNSGKKKGSTTLARTGALIIIIVIVVVILVGGLAAYYEINLAASNNTTTSTMLPTTTSTTSISSTSTSITSMIFTKTASTTSATSISTSSTIVSTSTSSSTTTTTSSTRNYALQLVQSGKPVLYSPLTTPLPKTYFPGDGPCCSIPPVYSDEINYTDQGNLWTLQGDLNPGQAWAFSNSSGLTMSLKTCASYNNPLNCSPHHEYWGDHESFNDVSLYADIGGIPVLPAGSNNTESPRAHSSASQQITLIPANASVFSAMVYIPYHSYFSSCHQDLGNGSNGCSYESTPYDSATLGFDVGGNYDIISVAELCNSPCTTNGLQMSAYTSQGGDSILKTLNTITLNTFTPLHRLTIATDRKTFIDFYVDNNLIYANSTMPISQSVANSGVIELSTRTSINNETSAVTFSNVSAYSGSRISVSGLMSGMTLQVQGSNDFDASATANSSGLVSVSVIQEPVDLMVSVDLNGKLIANYSQPVSAGAQLELTY